MRLNGTMLPSSVVNVTAANTCHVFNGRANQSVCPFAELLNCARRMRWNKLGCTMSRVEFKRIFSPLRNRTSSVTCTGLVTALTKIENKIQLNFMRVNKLSHSMPSFFSTLSGLRLHSLSSWCIISLLISVLFHSVCSLHLTSAWICLTIKFFRR